nr:ribbon-helix-helix domain-containing protein [Roseospira visakhapatnamensis]
MPALRARVRKRSISIAGHATSVSLEDPFWEALREIAAARGCSVADLVRRVDAARAAGVEEGEDGDGGPPANLSSALRVFVLDMVCAGQGTTGED